MAFKLLKTKTQENIQRKISRIDYVIKYGNGKPTNVAGLKNINELNCFKFPEDCDIIELYRQYHPDIYNSSGKIDEENLELKTVFFKGEYIPFIEAQEILKKNKLNEIALNENEDKEYSRLISQMIKEQASGIILCSGIPYLAKEDNTFFFHLDINGKMDTYSSIQSLEIASAKKYHAVIYNLEGKDAILTPRTSQKMNSFFESEKQK